MMASRIEKVVCTGGSGRLGRHVVGLLRGDCALIVLDLRPPEAEVGFVQADITDVAALQRAFAGQDAVIHLAAIPNPRAAAPDVTFRNNVQGTFAVLHAAEEAGVRRVIVASSDSVVGFHYNPPNWAPAYLPIDERHPVRPTEFYSLSKHVTETICRSYAHRGRLEVVVIRPTHIVFPPEYSELETRGSDLQNYHLWTYVAPEDVAGGFKLALGLPEVRFETFFISAADGLNTRPTLELVRERYGFLPEIRRPEIYERLPTASVLDTGHARAVLGFEPSSDWRRMAAPPTARAET
jgi:UDP-glucose 4-epimerase